MKPLLRGHFHQAAFFISLGACTMLLSLAKNTSEILALSIYSLGLIALFGVSAIYHRPQWNPRERAWMRRLDHSCIFILIAATGTPIGILALNSSDGRAFLTPIWIATIIGVLQSLFWVKAPKWLVAVLCLITGWLATPYIEELKAALGSINVWLIVSGGVVYTLGALIYALKRPNPYPKVFGYHEIFHIMVIIGAILHFIVIRSLIVTS